MNKNAVFWFVMGVLAVLFFGWLLKGSSGETSQNKFAVFGPPQGKVGFAQAEPEPIC